MKSVRRSLILLAVTAGTACGGSGIVTHTYRDVTGDYSVSGHFGNDTASAFLGSLLVTQASLDEPQIGGTFGLLKFPDSLTAVSGVVTGTVGTDNSITFTVGGAAANHWSFSGFLAGNLLSGTQNLSENEKSYTGSFRAIRQTVGPPPARLAGGPR